MKQDLLNAFHHAADHVEPEPPRQEWVRNYIPPEQDGIHQFVLFLKPELTAVDQGVHLDAALDLILERLDAFEVSLHAARALSGTYLHAHAIMDNHYGVINAISKQGESALTDAARQNLHDQFADELAAGATVMGAHQFLQKHPDFSPLALSVLNDNLGTVKLAGGSYALQVKVLGDHYILLNPFHPYQLVPYNTPGRAILVMEGRSRQPWIDLRDKLTGLTNPAEASPGSIRALLREKQVALGLKDVDQGSNGVHLSAGPLEGMVELRRFFTDHEAGNQPDWQDTAFGKLLLHHGCTPERVEELARNPVMHIDGEGTSAFDLTEECDAQEALERLT